MNTNKKSLLVIAAVVAVAAVGATAFAVVDDTGADKSEFCAQMPDSIGLYGGNPVTQMGFTIGTVDEIEDKGGYVEVTFSLDTDRVLPAEVQAITRSKSLLADRTLELVGNYEDGPQLESGTCIALDHSFTPKSISEITGSAADLIEKLSPEDGPDALVNAVSGLEQSLRGQGEKARDMMVHASQAASSPDRVISDIGSIILNTAPLTDDALKNWGSIQSILDQAPEVVTDAMGLWPGTIDTCVGVGWLVNVLYDIQTNYGDLIWPIVQGPVVDVIRLAAGRSKDIASLIESIPSVAAVLRQQAGNDGTVTLDYTPPTVRVAAPTGGSIDVPATDLLGMVLGGGLR